MTEKEKERFQQIKEELQNDSVLVKKFNNMTRKLISDDPSLTLQEAHNLVLSMLSMAYRGTVSLADDEMKDTMNVLTERIARYNAGGLNE